jgi:hypothetical protein
MHTIRILTNGTWHIYVDTGDELGDGIDGSLSLVPFFPTFSDRDMVNIQTFTLHLPV